MPIVKRQTPISQQDYADYWEHRQRDGGAILCPLCGEIGCLSDGWEDDLLYCPDCDRNFYLIKKVVGYEEEK